VRCPVRDEARCKRSDVDRGSSVTRLVAERVVSIYAAIHTAHRWLVVGSLSFSEGSQASTAFGGIESTCSEPTGLLPEWHRATRTSSIRTARSCTPR
jgi:hypothetical protein